MFFLEYSLLNHRNNSRVEKERVKSAIE